MGSLPALVCARGSRWMALPVMALGAALTLGGMMRLGAAPPAGEGPPAVRVVQPSVPQRHKWDPDHRAAIWHRLLTLTEGQGKGAARVVIWPETAIPFLYRTPSLEQAELAEALRGRTLVTGVVETAGAGRATNSVLVIGPDGLVRQRYDKNHLVPFGEYLPLAGLLRRLGLSELVQASGAFVPGTGRAPLDLPGLPPATPLICYEVIFPGERADGPAHWIVNVTNDAWFGDTPGPRQHLRHARLRAVESGLALVRVANNGISAAFDPYGRPLATLPLDARGTFETPLPPRAAAPYAVVGDWPLLALFTAALAAALARRRAGPSAGA
jgi:apolipoprotein N-acyltransferase